jgi:hypothetical protein
LVVGLPNDNIKIEILGRGGWVRARQTSGDRSGEVATTIDTQVSATATYLGIDGVQPFASVNFNIPTGKSILYGSQANARMDSDLVDIASFGEGFNVGPTIGLSLAIASNLVATFSAGYTWRGSSRARLFQPAHIPVIATTLNPGDVFTASAARLSDRSASGISLAPSRGNRYQIGRQQLFRAPTISHQRDAGLWLAREWGVTTATASASHGQKNTAFVSRRLMTANRSIAPECTVPAEHLFPSRAGVD